jgi:hypothetical protein
MKIPMTLILILPKKTMIGLTMLHYWVEPKVFGLNEFVTKGGSKGISLKENFQGGSHEFRRRNFSSIFLFHLLLKWRWIVNKFGQNNGIICLLRQ